MNALRSETTPSGQGISSSAPAGATLRIHLGGASPIERWVHVPAPSASALRDAAGPRWRPRRRASAIYVETGLEHLTIDESLRFLRECRRVLQKTGTLRIRTPNLDRVFSAGCRMSTDSDVDPLAACLQANASFRRGGIRFLYNDAALRAALREAGFDRVSLVTPGQSEVPELHGLERVESESESSEIPAQLIADASGVGERKEIPRSLFSDMTQVEEWRPLARLRARAGRILRLRSRD